MIRNLTIAMQLCCIFLTGCANPNSQFYDADSARQNKKSHARPDAEYFHGSSGNINARKPHGNKGQKIGYVDSSSNCFLPSY